MLNSPSMHDDKLQSKLGEIPPRSIVIFEDIDSIFIGRENVSSKAKKQVTFSGFLNALDGVRSKEGMIVFMTTNHIEKLDPALIRPGRCDVK